MSNIPSYYNNFKKNDEGEPDDMVSIRKIVGAMFIALFGATAAASPQQQQQITNRVEWRQHAFEPLVIAGKEKAELEKYVVNLEKAYQASVEGRKKEKSNKRRDEMFEYTAGVVSQS